MKQTASETVCSTFCVCVGSVFFGQPKIKSKKALKMFSRVGRSRQEFASWQTCLPFLSLKIHSTECAACFIF